MIRLSMMALVVATVAACGGKSNGTQTGGSQEIVAKKMILSWGIQPGPDAADIYLASTDETGGQVSHSIGHYAGTCTPAQAAPVMKALTSVLCATPDGGGTEIDAVVRDGEVIILAVRYEGGMQPDPMGRERVTSIPVPVGTGVEVAR